MNALKIKIISTALKFVLALVAIGTGVWYLSHSIGDANLPFVSMDSFMSAINANGNTSNTNGCFLCNYISELFETIGRTSEMFWKTIIGNLWLLMAIGFGIYIFIHAIQYIWERAKANASYSDKANNLDFKTWVKPILTLGLRILIFAAVIGAIGLGGNHSLKIISDIIISPVLYIGSWLSSSMTTAVLHTSCPVLDFSNANNVIAPISTGFQCVVGNLNTLILAGASGGFSLMNFSWLGLGGGVLTWIAGLSVVVLFLIVGFDLFFQLFTIIFKLVFFVIFLPIILAAFAYEKTWKLASGIFNKSVNMLVKSAVKVISITLKVVILVATVNFAADATFPGGTDGYNAVFPPLFYQDTNLSEQNTQVLNAFKLCDEVSRVDTEEQRDKEIFKQCFLEQKAIIESEHPGAFDFMYDGWDFLILVITLMLLYFYVIGPKVDKLLPAGDIKTPIPGEKADVSTKGEEFDFGGWIHNLGQKVWHFPSNLLDKIGSKIE
ncbi:MAG: hypothetical protein ACLRFI_00060 [Alphaproteobacteria bacterium]